MEMSWYGLWNRVIVRLKKGKWIHELSEGGRRGFVQGFLSTLWPLWLIEIKLLWPLNTKLLFIQVAREKNRMNFPFCEFSCILKNKTMFHLLQKRIKRTISRHHAPDAVESYYRRCYCFILLSLFSPCIYLTLISITLASSFPWRVGWAYYNDI